MYRVCLISSDRRIHFNISLHFYLLLSSVLAEYFESHIYSAESIITAIVIYKAYPFLEAPRCVIGLSCGQVSFKNLRHHIAVEGLLFRL